MRLLTELQFCPTSSKTERSPYGLRSVFLFSLLGLNLLYLRANIIAELARLMTAMFIAFAKQNAHQSGQDKLVAVGSRSESTAVS